MAVAAADAGAEAVVVMVVDAVEGRGVGEETEARRGKRKRTLLQKPVRPPNGLSRPWRLPRNQNWKSECMNDLCMLYVLI